MNKELEEAISWLKDNIKYYQEQIKFIETTDCDYYEEEKNLYKKRIKIFQTILNYIENSISKKEIEEKIKKFKKCKDITPYGIGKLEVLQELLEKVNT